MTQELENLSLQQALQELPHEEGNGPSAVQVRSSPKLIDGDLPLQSFLEQLLPALCELFPAKAAVAWLRAQGARWCDLWCSLSHGRFAKHGI